MEAIKIIVISGKIFAVSIMALYAVFAYILIKRVRLMNANLTTPYRRFFTKMAKIHFILSILVIILAVINL